MTFELNYFSASEQAFMKFGNPRFSALDWAYVGALEDAQVALESVLLGIHRTFEERKSTIPVRRFSYCLPEIYRAQEKMNEDEMAGHGDFKRSVRRQFLGE